jgi:hypothetical protein
MARPVQDPKAPKDYISRVVINRREYDKVMKIAQRKGISFSQLMRDALAMYLLEERKQQKIPFRDVI